MSSSGAANVAVLRPVPFLKCAQATIQQYELPIHTHTVVGQDKDNVTERDISSHGADEAYVPVIKCQLCVAITFN